MVRVFQLTILIIFTLISCNSNKEQKNYHTLYLTSNTNDVYAFDIQNKKLKWLFPSFNTEVNDELSYFTITGNKITKSYVDGTIIQLNKLNGTTLNHYKDKEDETQSYYGYDFNNVAFVQFYQYPQMYQSNAIFANSHGEIKSINLQNKKKNWVYIQNQIIYTSPKIEKNIVYVNTNYEILALDAKTGKKLFKTTLEEVSPNELIIDNENIYILGEYNTLACYNLKLEKQWSLKAENTSQSSTHNLLITEESIYFGGNELYSVNKNTGELNWKCLLYDKNNSQNNLLSATACGDNVIAMTSEKFLKIDTNGKIIFEKKCQEKLIGKLFYCNDWYYFLTENGTIKQIDGALQKEEVFYTGIKTDPNHRVDNSFFYAE